MVKLSAPINTMPYIIRILNNKTQVVFERGYPSYQSACAAHNKMQHMKSLTILSINFIPNVW